ncbi:hypothetical protein [Streptomyces sp. NPDC096339]|uniref:hypothetical protein n=1 Tax=Streptomyces sp. NPDC096339 TaxID=3366086 RepID=UPI0037FDCCB9
MHEEPLPQRRQRHGPVRAGFLGDEPQQCQLLSRQAVFAFLPAPVRTTLVDVVPGVGYSDDVDVDGVPGRFTHRIEPDGDGGSRVTFVISMPTASAEAVAAGFPAQLAALADYARNLGA